MIERINAFQVFKLLTDNVDQLIIPRELTHDVLKTHLYDKVEAYRTLRYTVNNRRSEYYVEQHRHQ